MSFDAETNLDDRLQSDEEDSLQKKISTSHQDITGELESKSLDGMKSQESQQRQKKEDKKEEEENEMLIIGKEMNFSSEKYELLKKECYEKDERIRTLNETVADLRSTLSDAQNNFENRLKQQQLDSIRKENIYIMKLTLKEQEVQECLAKIESLNQSRIPTSTQLQSYLLDPSLNYMFEKMRKEVDVAKSRVEEMQNDMSAWKFSADSNTGKQLMAKCRLLHQENEELGKMISSGKIAKLESGLAIHKNFSEELKKSQSEFEEVLMEMEEDIDGFQNTVLYLQQQLKESHEKNAQIERELSELRSKLGLEGGGSQTITTPASNETNRTQILSDSMQTN